MAGTQAGGIKARQTNKERYGEDFYSDIAKKTNAAWIKNGKKPRGFSVNRELAQRAGVIGGKISRRGKANREAPVEAHTGELQDVLRELKG